eukprot:scaffold644_cov357-Pavlova_lutheri.AAC.51
MLPNEVFRPTCHPCILITTFCGLEHSNVHHAKVSHSADGGAHHRSRCTSGGQRRRDFLGDAGGVRRAWFRLYQAMIGAEAHVGELAGLRHGASLQLGQPLGPGFERSQRTFRLGLFFQHLGTGFHGPPALFFFLLPRHGTSSFVVHAFQPPLRPHHLQLGSVEWDLPSNLAPPLQTRDRVDGCGPQRCARMWRGGQPTMAMAARRSWRTAGGRNRAPPHRIAVQERRERRGKSPGWKSRGAAGTEGR